MFIPGRSGLSEPWGQLWKKEIVRNGELPCPCVSWGWAQEDDVKRKGDKDDFSGTTMSLCTCSLHPFLPAPSPSCRPGSKAPRGDSPRGFVWTPHAGHPLLLGKPPGAGILRPEQQQWAAWSLSALVSGAPLPRAPTVPLALAAPWERRKQHLTCVAYSKTK